MANFRPEIGHDATLNGHNSVILSDIDVRPHQNDQLGETDRMV